MTVGPENLLKNGQLI
jgi:nitrite reductase/ring-hydroxylating ferredoxin subunit